MLIFFLLFLIQFLAVSDKKLNFFQIISDYCKNVHQSKPFSHIIMDLFRRVVQHITYPTFNEKEEPQHEVVQGIVEETSNKDEIK